MALSFKIEVFLIALYVSSSLKIADQWDRAVVLRLGNFHALKGPGLFFIVPLIDRITAWIDTRTISTSFKAEKTLTTQIEIYSFLNCRSTRKHFTDLAECFLGSALWSPSYFAGSCGGAPINIVRKYIESQKTPI